MLLFLIFPLTIKSFICERVKLFKRFVNALSNLLPDSFLLILQTSFLNLVMNKKILKIIVTILSALIILCILVLIYGIYLKLQPINNNQITNLYKKSDFIKKSHIIQNIETTRNKYLLIKMKNKTNEYFIVYDYKKDRIIKILNNN